MKSGTAPAIRWDWRGEEIDICARIFSVADAFDAITSNRVYRKGKSYDAAAQELDEWVGKQFDPKVVEAFHRVPPQDLGRASPAVVDEERGRTASASHG